MQLKSFILIEKENNFLLIAETRRKWKGLWFFPGGTSFPNEDPVSAVMRETKEETGCGILLDGLFYFRLYKGFFRDTLHVYYHGRIAKPDFETDKFSEKFKWFSYEELSKAPLRQDALQVVDAFRTLRSTLPIYNFNYISGRNIRKELPPL
jgi:8-oxo-dGTP pyrophosphatase MutT (NUDIX family)